MDYSPLLKRPSTLNSSDQLYQKTLRFHSGALDRHTDKSFQNLAESIGKVKLQSRFDIT